MPVSTRRRQVGPTRARHRRPAGAPVRLVALAVGCALLSGVGIVLVGIVAAADGDDDPPTLVAAERRPEVEALGLLADWDRSRAACWARADPACLRGLYATGSPAGSADVAALEQWRSRGLRVEGLRTQVLDLRLRERTRERVVIEVVDRVADAEAVASTGARRTLPDDAPSRRLIELTRLGAGGRWVVASVSDLPARS